MRVEAPRALSVWLAGCVCVGWGGGGFSCEGLGGLMMMSCERLGKKVSVKHYVGGSPPDCRDSCDSAKISSLHAVRRQSPVVLSSKMKPMTGTVVVSTTTTVGLTRKY